MAKVVNRGRMNCQECLAKQQNTAVTSKTSHQNILEAEDWQKELVVKCGTKELQRASEVGNPLLPLCQGLCSSGQASDSAKWAWCNAQQQVFDNIKLKVRTSLVLANPVNGKLFHLCTDASDYAIGAVLEQKGKDGQWHVVAYGSHSLTSAEIGEHFCVFPVTFLVYYFKIK